MMAKASLDRRAVVAELLQDRDDLLVVTGLGSPSWDAYAAGDHDLTYYLWAGMGSATTTGLGLALAQPKRPVLVLTGDGEMLMGMGALATAALKAPENLTIVALDNGAFGETGNQASHTAAGVSLAGIARACGFPYTTEIDGMAEVARLRLRVHARTSLAFATIHIGKAEHPKALPPRDGVHVKNRLRAALGLQTI